MNALKIGLLVLVACLLSVSIIDRMRETAPLLLIRDSVANLQSSVDTLQSTNREQQQQLSQLRQQLSERPLTSSSATNPDGTQQDHAPQVAPEPAGDGNPKLGANFLMPYENSYYNPAWLGGTLHEFNDSPKGLNPLIDNSKITHDIWDLVDDSLCDRPPTHPEQWSQSLATSVVISDDYKVYTFALRHGVKWQRPEIAKRPEFAWLNKDVELTADDFKFCVDLILNPQVDCPSLRNYYVDLDRAEVVDRYTFRMVWKRKVYTSLAFSLGLYPMPRHVYLFNADGTPVPPQQIGISFNQSWFDREHALCGVGRYILQEFQPDKVIRLRRNPEYWGVGLHFENIEYALDVKKMEPRLTAFKDGQVQAMSMSPLQYKKEILDHNDTRFAALDPSNPKAGRTGELAWERFKSLSFTYLGWNMRKPPFNDIRVRQAMSYAFPKKRIIEQVFYGLGSPVLSDIPLSSQYLNTTLEPYDFDLDKARALLAAAGWKDADGSGQLSKTIDGQVHQLKFTIKTIADYPDWDNALLIYKNQLAKIGVTMLAEPLEWKELMRVYEDKDFEALVGAWAMDIDIDYYQLWHSSQAEVQGGSNMCGLKDPEVDALADQLRLTFDTSERITIVKRLQQIINREQPYTFFQSGEGIVAWQNRGKPAKDRYLDGVGYGLDHLNPLFNRKHLYWHFRND